MTSFIKYSKEEAFELFPGITPEFRDALASSYMKLQEVYFVFIEIEFYTSFVGIVLTFFHLIILTRKSMRTSSVMSVMFGIAICDFVSMFSAIGINSIIDRMKITDCTPPNTHRAIQLFVYLQTIRDNAIRCSTWLSVLMALFRYLMLKLIATPGGAGRLAKPSFGFRAFGVALVISTMFSCLYLFRGEIVQVGEWRPKDYCPDQSMGSQPRYTNIVSELFKMNNEIIRRVYKLLDEVTSKIIPCLLFPILTVFLIVEFQKAQKKRHISQTSNQMNTELTTRLIIFMTLSFFIALLPAGIITCFTSAYTDIGFLYLGSYVDHICYTLLTINATFHCPICFAMCTQYRKTVMKLLKLPRVNIVTHKNTASSIEPQAAPLS